MSVADCFIGLGSNLGDSLDSLKSATNALSTHQQVSNGEVSSFYRSKPHGPQDQPDYTNAVARLSSGLEPLDLLDLLQQIEQSHGRVRDGTHWGPRTLDLDLLLYADQEIDHPRLVVPHPFMLQREFVLVPLLEIAPEARLPDGTQIESYRAQVDISSLEVI